MKDCSRFQNRMEAYLAEQLAPEDREILQAHFSACSDCRQIAELHQELTLSGPAMAPAAQQDLDALRNSVLLQITPNRRRQASGSAWTPDWFVAWLRRPVPVLAMGVLLLLAGAGLGQAWAPSGPPGLEKQDLVREISDMAAAHRRLADVEDSKFIYSNVSFRKLDRNRVALNFDVSTHVDIVEPVDSPLVQEVLVQSLLHPDPANLGSRLKAISYAEIVMDSKVLEALILAMHEDTNLAVRLKALSILSLQPPASQVEAAFLKALRRDESVQMRLLALDYLANQGVDFGLIRRTIEEAGKVSNPALLLQAASYEQ